MSHNLHTSLTVKIFAHTSSVVTIVIVLILCMVDIFMKEVPDDAQWSAFPSSVRVGPGQTRPATIFDIFSSASKFVFAMGGQKIYLEMMAAMREPSHFPRSLYSATPVILVVYASVSIASYAKVGKWCLIHGFTGGAMLWLAVIAVLTHA